MTTCLEAAETRTTQAPADRALGRARGRARSKTCWATCGNPEHADWQTPRRRPAARLEAEAEMTLEEVSSGHR